MKIATKVAEVTTNFAPGATVEMSVDAHSMAHIMNTLTDMYANPWEALGRELISNALDAHAEQNGLQVTSSTVFPKPVEVSLPSNLNPEFVVKDYGIGMSRDTLMNVFPKYGASTKRNTNDQIGGFGLGAKTPFAVSENFVVETVHNGKKNVAIFQKNERGVGEGNFLPEQDTDATNGTVIRVTLRAANRLIEAFRNQNLLLGFPAGSIVVDGKAVTDTIANTDLFTPLADNLGWMRTGIQRGFGSGNTAVIGTVAYDLRDFFRETRRDAWGFVSNVVLNIPIGTVDLTPSRDSLIFSQRTNAALADLYAKAEEAYVKGIHETIQTASDVDAVKAVLRATEILRTHDVHTWKKGESVIPTRFDSLKVKSAGVSVANTIVGDRRIHTYGENTFSFYPGATVIVDVADLTETEALNKNLTRYRKGAAIQGGADSSRDCFTYVAGGNLDALSRWGKAYVQGHAKAVLTVAEYLEVVEVGREVEREQARVRRAELKALKAERGIDQEVTAYRYGSTVRVTLKFANDSYPNVAYLSANEADGSLAQKYTEVSKKSDIKTFAKNIATGGINDFTLIYLPKSVKLDEFKAQFPNIKSVDVFLATLPEKGQDVADVAAKAVIVSRKFRKASGWLFLAGMTDEKVATIINDDLRAWAERTRTLAQDVYNPYMLERGSFSTSSQSASYDSIVYTSLPGFAEAKEAYEAQAPAYGLLRHVSDTWGVGTDVADDVIEYLNLKNPA